jgi:hypothetical protein
MIRLTVIVTLLLVVYARAQSRAPAVDTLGIDEVAMQATMLITSQKFTEAQPYLERLLRDLAGVTDNPAAARALEYATFFTGMAPYADNRMDAAIQRFEQYLSRYPFGQYAPQAVLMIAEVHASSGAWDKALPYLHRALQMPGLLARDRPAVVLMLGEAQFRLKQWEPALQIMSEVLRTSSQTSELHAAALFTALSLIELNRFDDLFRFLPILRKTEVQYDIDLNISLIEAGDKLIEENKYLEALTLYQSVFTKSQLVTKAEKVLATRQREQRAFRPAGANPARMLQRREELQRRVTEAEERLKRIQAYPNYEIPLNYRSGVWSLGT